MPYHNGERVSNEEWIRLNYGDMDQMHTGPSGENPASPPEIDEATGAPPVKAKAKRGARSSKAAKAAVADAMGVKADSPKLDAIDVTGLDAEVPSDSQ